jgi:1,4-alpha-glucan branching enzyme
MASTPKNIDKQKQTFHFRSPAARSVLLVGDFTHWQERGIPMSRGKDGIWTTSVELQPGKHTYRFIVDGEWRDDPECRIRVDNPYGGHDMVREAA